MNYEEACRLADVINRRLQQRKSIGLGSELDGADLCSIIHEMMGGCGGCAFIPSFSSIVPFQSADFVGLTEKEKWDILYQRAKDGMISEEVEV